jgi:hypothetical protein
MFDVRRLAVELMLVARPSANLGSPSESTERVADGSELGEETLSEITADTVRGGIRSMYLAGQKLVNICSNRIPVVIPTPKGRRTMSLTFKAALSYGKSTSKKWFQEAVGPQADDAGNPIGLNRAARTRLRSDLKRGLISRREATFLGIQSALVVTTRFKIMDLEEWAGFRHELFKACYECGNISKFGKQWKKFTTAVQNQMLMN